MICELSGKEARFCTPSLSMYKRGCRCEGARKANTERMREWYSANNEHHREYSRAYMAEYRRTSMKGDRTECPICGRMTASRSGFCPGCEAKI